MNNLTIVATKDRKPGRPEPIGEVEGEIEYGANRGAITSGARQLIMLLGNGFGDMSFHIVVDGDVMLVNCRCSGMGTTHVAGLGTADCFSFSYEKEQPAP